MNGKTIFQSALMILGAIIIVINSSWWLLLGIFLAIWGNNIQMDDTIDERIEQSKEE